VSWIRN